MKARIPHPKPLLAAVAGIAIAAFGLCGLSYVDVRASTGKSQLALVSLTPDSAHILVLRWRMGEYNPEVDMPGQYVLWTLRPFRKVQWFK